MKKILLKFSPVVSLVVFYPVVAFAANNSSGCFATYQAGKKLGDLFTYGTCLISNTLIPLLFALAIVIFLWGVTQFIMNSGEEAKRTQGKQFMIWGIIALTVMIGVWSLVGILGNSFGVNTSSLPYVQP